MIQNDMIITQPQDSHVLAGEDTLLTLHDELMDNKDGIFVYMHI